MPKKPGRPKEAPKKVMVTLAAHHAEQLQRIADENGTYLATVCANILERYVFEEQGILASDILKNAVTETIHREMTSHSNRVRQLLSRTALESIATREVAKITLQGYVGELNADKYSEQSWQYAVHQLKNPTQAMREALKLISENIANDDPGVLLSIRESNREVAEKLKEVESLRQQVEHLTQHQNSIVHAVNKMADNIAKLEERNRHLERIVIEAVNEQGNRRGR